MLRYVAGFSTRGPASKLAFGIAADFHLVTLDGAVDDDGGDETHPNDQQAKEHQRDDRRRVMLQRRALRKPCGESIETVSGETTDRHEQEQ
ncbi:hypothetical protein RL4199 [Rhizobium johnstonii 3841]|uniref:Uncharacterized protein n=1 Tax=Rhizobium johnstonii (strain DSM 114642 / LMG 32736 / 3841) TaxID=216596 RepID=Q1MBJ5_RHIJ3|nr:hypothetical protein RL4199 [Rhizobium johnstonii 3841]